METTKRYYSKFSRNEVFEPSVDTIALGDGVIDWWFNDLPDGYELEYDVNGIPAMVKAPVTPPVDPNEDAKQVLRDKMNHLVDDMTMPEAMFLMLKYGMEKMNPPSNDEPDDAGSGNDPLTPNGEDLIAWGDNIAIKLEEYITQLRAL